MTNETGPAQSNTPEVVAADKATELTQDATTALGGVSEEIEAEAKALLEHPLCPSLNDTHSGNFMLNGRYLVITDPSSNDYSMRSHKEAIMRKLGLAV